MPKLSAAFFAAVRKSLFSGKLSQGQVDGMTAIAAAFDRDGDGNPRHLAYMLATALHETAHTMAPIHELGSRSYFDKYEPSTKIGKTLGNTKTGDGYLFRGRGFVQLTGRANYDKANDKLGLPLLLSNPPKKPLVTNPDMALQPDIAARILVRGMIEGWFTGKKLSDFTAYHDMRRVVNGLDKADDIAIYARSFEAALSAQPVVETEEPSPAPEQPAAPSSGATPGWLAALLDLIRSLLGRKP